MANDLSDVKLRATTVPSVADRALQLLGCGRGFKMASTKKCGPHTELTSTDAVRVTRCACGTIHVTMLGSGVTVRMSTEAFRGIASGLKAATERLDEDAQFGTTSIN